MAPGEVRGGLAPAPQPLVAVDPLVGDGGVLAPVVQQAGDELPADLAQLVRRAGLVEGVGVALEERHVRVHAAAGVLGEDLGHEGRVDTLLERDLLDHRAEGHDVVRGGERVGVAQVDLVLPRCALVVAELHGDADRLEHRDRRPAEVVRLALGHVVEVAAVVDRLRPRALGVPWCRRKNSISGWV